MEKFEGKLSDNSLWLTATPTPLAQTLPFYITEAGHFSTASDYIVKRDLHDSFLLLYTCKGCGCVRTNNTSVLLPCEHALIIDCHTPHEYFSLSGGWDFLWLHFRGSAVEVMFDIIYPNNSVRAVAMDVEGLFQDKILSIMDMVSKNDIRTSVDVSSQLHSLINLMYAATLKAEESNQQKDSREDIRTVLSYIKKNYSKSISIDDMINTIHISKYHFIRRFSRIMGVTPYNYLTNYRITMAKTLLRETDKTISAIAEECGFLDTSNFIAQFKKRTGQKPLQYRRDFT